jgi:hypothetical protein
MPSKISSRPIGGTQTGFGSVIARFNEGHDQRNFNTTFEDFHGAPPKPEVGKTVEEFQAEYNK